LGINQSQTGQKNPLGSSVRIHRHFKEKQLGDAGRSATSQTVQNIVQDNKALEAF
jgi:hypothetical protein